MYDFITFIGKSSVEILKISSLLLFIREREERVFVYLCHSWESYHHLLFPDLLPRECALAAAQIPIVIHELRIHEHI